MTESCLECQTKLFKEWEKFTPDKALIDSLMFNEVQVGKDQEKAQSEKDSHSKNRGGKKPN